MRGLRWGLALIGVLLLATLGWSSWRAWQVRSDLLTAQEAAATVQSQLGGGQLDLALEALPPLRSQLDRAANRTRGPLWGASERIPLLGANFRAVRRVADSAQIIGAEVLPAAADALTAARRDPLLRDGKVDLAALDRVRLVLAPAQLAMARADDLVSEHAGHLLPPVASGLNDARHTTAHLAETLRSASRGLALAPDMLGRGGARHYLVAVQNDAEARATGGLVGAFAIISADHGAIHLDRTGVNDELTLVGHPL
ncbi:MAG: arsenical pump rane protein, partial [Frankiales bacterium]|nr:arsenical pump rane protein [Frankiales bacterium]